MDANELGRRRAYQLHCEAVSRGESPEKPYEFACEIASELGLDVEPTAPGAAVLDNGRATLVTADKLILHEDIGSEFERAFLVAHEIGHHELGDAQDSPTAIDIDPARPAEPSPVGFDRVVDYGRRQRREVQMDLFARELLLPRAYLRALHLEDGLSASAIAKRLQAPFDVVAQQLFDALLLPAVEPETKVHAEKPLNDAQREAACHRGVGYLLEAGPGTGKTQTLTARVVGLLAEDVDPRRILVLTYSNKAAGEMTERIARRAPEAASAMWIGTFHAFGLDLIRRFTGEFGFGRPPRMMDRVEAVELLEQIFPRLHLSHYRNIYDPTRVIGDILSAISRAKDEVVDHSQYLALADAMCAGAAPGSEQAIRGAKAREVALVYDAYEALKSDRIAVDFGDLVAKPVMLLESRPDILQIVRDSYDHVLVDEYQDVNRSSVRLLEALCPGGRNLWAVGDARQSIYRFRGASSFNTARFDRDDFPGAKRGRLEINYRSKQEIVDLFSAFGSAMQAARGHASLTANRGQGGEVPQFRTVTAKDEQTVAIGDTIEEIRAAGWKYRDQAVLCTGNQKLSEIGRDLERLGIPVLFLGSLFERPEVKDILSLLSLLVDGRAMGLMRIARMPEFRMSLGDVGSLIDYLRESESADCGWLQDTNALPVSSEGKAALARLAAFLGKFDETAQPWTVAAEFILDYTAIAARIAGSGSLSERSQGLALWQFLNFLRVQPAAAGTPILRLLHRVKRLVQIGDDRDLRQLPQAAQQLDAVRLMTIHGSKGLEFPCVHLPGLNQDTLPGNYKPPACLPPDGMIAGAGADSAAAHRAGEAEERECLFYVATSRAQDRLFMYAVTRTTRGARKVSEFADRIGHKLRRQSITPSRALPPEPESLPIAIDVDGPLRFHGAQLALHENCPRRFFYTHIMRVGGKRTETDYMKMHEATRAVAASAIKGEVDLGNRDEFTAALGAACDAQQLGTEGLHADLRSLAVSMLTYFHKARAGHSPTVPSSLALRIGTDEILFRPDERYVSLSGSVVFRRMRTGHRRASESTDLGAAIAMLAANDHDAGSSVELMHLADEEAVPLEFTEKVLSNRRQTLEEMMAQIRAGQFAPERNERTCPGCPAFFICGAIPDGRLIKKF